MRIQTYGGVPVPYTVSWSAEESFHVAHCPHGRGIAICQAVAPGQGKPRFGKPHSQRQREAIASGLCDLCASREACIAEIINTYEERLS